MTDFLNQSRAVLSDLSIRWAVEEENSENDIQLLNDLIHDEEMQGAWLELNTAWNGSDPENAVRQLLVVVFRLREGIPDWIARSGSERSTRMDQIAHHAKALRTAVSDTPFLWLSSAALDAIGVKVPDVRVTSGDFLIGLEDLLLQVDEHRDDKPILGRPNQTLAHRRYFVIMLNRHFSYHFESRMLSVIQPLARLALEDDEIDRETVRKILDS
jgi:hypothetical protein